MNPKIIVQRFLLILGFTTGICFIAHADNCSGGVDCNTVPANNTGAHVVGGVIAAGAVGTAIIKKRKKKPILIHEDLDKPGDEKPEEDNDMSLEDFFLPKPETEAGSDSGTTGSEGGNATENENNNEGGDRPPPHAGDSTKHKFFDAPLGEEPPDDDPKDG